jgi:PAS domain S-box-containing protein
MTMVAKSPSDPDAINRDDILDGVPHGIAILDDQLRIVTMNRSLEAMTGFTCADAIGVYGDSIIRSNLGTRGQVFHQVFTTGETLTVEGDIINRDRRKILIQFTISPLRGQSEKIRGLIIVLEDISSLHAVMNTALFPESSTGILGHSLKMQEVFELMPLMAHTDASILITGETGTGKDLIAEAIHKASKRGRHPFIKINCGALPESLLESELFGHVKGSFTGAIKDKPGMFKLAQEGTLFLTEIGDMPLPLQVKLLSVLDDREFFPVGGDKKVKVDVRIIAATHRSLKEQVEKGNFREDLFYRLNVLHMHLPPLREREGDIRFLLDHFLREFTKRLE